MLTPFKKNFKYDNRRFFFVGLHHLFENTNMIIIVLFVLGLCHIFINSRMIIIVLFFAG